MTRFVKILILTLRTRKRVPEVVLQRDQGLETLKRDWVAGHVDPNALEQITYADVLSHLHDMVTKSAAPGNGERAGQCPIQLGDVDHFTVTCTFGRDDDWVKIQISKQEDASCTP